MYQLQYAIFFSYLVHCIPISLNATSRMSKAVRWSSKTMTLFKSSLEDYPQGGHISTSQRPIYEMGMPISLHFRGIRGPIRRSDLAISVSSFHRCIEHCYFIHKILIISFTSSTLSTMHCIGSLYLSLARAQCFADNRALLNSASLLSGISTSESSLDVALETPMLDFLHSGFFFMRVRSQYNRVLPWKSSSLRPWSSMTSTTSSSIMSCLWSS